MVHFYGRRRPMQFRKPYEVGCGKRSMCSRYQLGVPPIISPLIWRDPWCQMAISILLHLCDSHATYVQVSSCNSPSWIQTGLQNLNVVPWQTCTGVHLLSVTPVFEQEMHRASNWIEWFTLRRTNRIRHIVVASMVSDLLVNDHTGGVALSRAWKHQDSHRLPK